MKALRLVFSSLYHLLYTENIDKKVDACGNQNSSNYHLKNDFGDHLAQKGFPVIALAF